MSTAPSRDSAQHKKSNETATSSIPAGTKFTRLYNTAYCCVCEHEFRVEELWTNGDYYCLSCLTIAKDAWRPLTAKEKPFKCGECGKRLRLGEAYEQVVEPGVDERSCMPILCAGCASKREKERAELPPRKKHKK